jgi:hypothetical protein
MVQLIFTIFLLKHKQNSGQDDFIILNNIRESKKIWNSGGVITDLGDGIINLEFLSKWIRLVVMFTSHQ